MGNHQTASCFLAPRVSQPPGSCPDAPAASDGSQASACFNAPATGWHEYHDRPPLVNTCRMQSGLRGGASLSLPALTRSIVAASTLLGSEVKPPVAGTYLMDVYSIVKMHKREKFSHLPLHLDNRKETCPFFRKTVFRKQESRLYLRKRRFRRLSLIGLFGICQIIPFFSLRLFSGFYVATVLFFPERLHFELF